MEKNKCGNRYSPEVRELAEIYQILGCHRRKNVRLLGECGFMGVPDHLQSETFGKYIPGIYFPNVSGMLNPVRSRRTGSCWRSCPHTLLKGNPPRN
jgi:hypothetical protein